MQREPPPAGGPVISTGTVVAPLRRVLGLSRRIYVRGNADFGAALFLEDGDLVVVRDVSGTVSLGGFLNAAGDTGPSGQPGTSAVDTPVYILFRGDFYFPAPGAPIGALIARVTHGSWVQNAFVVGMGSSFHVHSLGNQDAPIQLEFGINDCFTEDNSGEFQAMVDVFRG